MNDPRRTFESISASLTAVITDVVRSGWYLLGTRTEQFESAFAEATGAPHCIGVANGTDALEIALRSLGVERGDEVVTVSNAGGYTLTAVAAIGAVPVFVDVDPATLTLDLNQAVRAVGPRTMAVVATHLFGWAIDVPRLRRLLDDSGWAEVPILEDAAQAHGAAFHGRRVGSMGDAACFSFYPTKNLGAMGDGGAVTTVRSDVADRARALHQYGWTERYVSTHPGGRNSRIDEIQAAILTEGLVHLDEWNERRRWIVERYRAASSDAIGMVHNPRDDAARFVAHLAIARTPHRDEAAAHFARRGVATAVHYPVLDTDVVWLKTLGHVRHPTPNAEQARDEILSLPCFPALDDDEVDQVCSALTDFEPTRRSL
jgi:aminotransferase EvaB